MDFRTFRIKTGVASAFFFKEEGKYLKITSATVTVDYPVKSASKVWLDAYDLQSWKAHGFAVSPVCGTDAETSHLARQ